MDTTTKCKLINNCQQKHTHIYIYIYAHNQVKLNQSKLAINFCNCFVNTLSTILLYASAVLYPYRIHHRKKIEIEKLTSTVTQNSHVMRTWLLHISRRVEFPSQFNANPSKVTQNLSRSRYPSPQVTLHAPHDSQDVQNGQTCEHIWAFTCYFKAICSFFRFVIEPPCKLCDFSFNWPFQ